MTKKRTVKDTEKRLNKVTQKNLYKISPRNPREILGNARETQGIPGKHRERPGVTPETAGTRDNPGTPGKHQGNTQGKNRGKNTREYPWKTLG